VLLNSDPRHAGGEASPGLIIIRAYKCYVDLLLLHPGARLPETDSHSTLKNQANPKEVSSVLLRKLFS